MLEFLKKLFEEQMKLSPELWLMVMMSVVAAAFIVTLIMGLTVGKFAKIKSLMSSAASNPSNVVAKMKQMPVGVKTLYKNARIGNVKPSALVTESVCVDEPYRNSLISKVWLATFVATMISACFVSVVSIAAPTPEDATVANLEAAYLSPAFVLLLGGFLTFIGAIIGNVAHSGASGVYAKFAAAIDGDQPASGKMEVQPDNDARQQSYVEPQAEYANRDGFADDSEPSGQPYYAQAQDSFQTYEASEVVAEEPANKDDVAKKAREAVAAQARAAQAAQAAQAAAQAAQPRVARPTQQPVTSGGSSSADEVIAQIDKIDREGATRETMREVATLLQKERAKPENKTPEQQKRLNEALSKLLKAMSSAAHK